MKTQIKHHPNVSALAARLLLKARDSILAEPDTYNQADGHLHGSLWKTRPSCGSPACIIGWMIYHRWLELRGDSGSRRRLKKALRTWSDIAVQLGMADADQFCGIWYRTSWPRRYQHGIRVTESCAAARINYFIKHAR